MLRIVPEFSTSPLPVGQRVRVLIAAAGLVVALTPVAAFAQAAAPQITLPPVTVTAQKEPADPQKLPVSVTALPEHVFRDAGIAWISDAAIYAPNTYFSDFTARKLSNARFRGIGASPANPSITTFIDGVPQLNANTSSSELVNVGQAEFVRGPQSALFGRNTLGGLINIVSGRPSLARWTGGISAPFGSKRSREVRGYLSGPVNDTLAVSVALGHGERDGFTTNQITGNDVDFRSGTFGKGQILWTPTASWEARVILSGERARDGDYALSDLGQLRASAFQTSRDFEGFTNRDIFSTTVLAKHEGQKVTFSSTTGIVNWNTQDVTDLDYTPLSLVTRDNTEEALQFTQEVRFASAAAAPLKIGAGSLRWQMGALVFTQKFDQDAVNTIQPFVFSPQLPFAIDNHSPTAALDDVGLGVYGQATVTVNDKVDLSGGLRVDYERKEASLETFFLPAIAPPTLVTAEKTFSSVSPQASLAYRLNADQMAYASIGSGFKAGGFNPASPAGSEAYDEEKALHFESGVKTMWANGKVRANAAVFYINWDNLQLNVPTPQSLGQFYISNVGQAESKGFELELSARPHGDVDVFAEIGVTRARFSADSSANGADVSGNKIPNTPDYTATFGAQVTHAINPRATLYGRGEVVFYGAFQYDEANSQQQDAYSLANFRAGVRGKVLFVEGWVRNAFDTRYIPIAIPYANFAPSGFVGENGKPRTFGLTVGVTF
jgi:iron complex outermembrane receptor protein